MHHIAQNMQFISISCLTTNEEKVYGMDIPETSAGNRIGKPSELLIKNTMAHRAQKNGDEHDK